MRTAFEDTIKDAAYKDVQVAHALVLEGSDSRDLTLVYKIEEGPLYLIDTVSFYWQRVPQHQDSF